MKDLCARSRAVMNLLLLISMLQVWILVSEDHSSVVENTRRLCSDLMLMQSMAQAIGTTKDFVLEYERTLVGGSSWNVQQIRLSSILAISTYDFDRSFPDRESIHRIAVQGPPGTESQMSKVVATTHDDATAILDGLRETIEHAHLPPDTSTIFDLEKLSEKEIDLPFVHAGVDVHIAFRVLAVGSLLVIAMLYSLVDSIWRVGTETNSWGDDPVLDVPFLYPSKWARCLATIWIGSPSLLVAAGTFGLLKVAMNTRESLALVGIACLIAFIAIRIFWRVRMIRAHLSEHKKAPGPESRRGR
jgi:hypothetical protein